MARDRRRPREKALAVALLIVAYASGCGSSQKPADGSDRETEAWVAAQDFVTKQLKSPSTAEFPWYDDKAISHTGQGRYTIRSYVDAENSFGAKLRKNFRVTVRHAGGDTWKLEELTMDE